MSGLPWWKREALAFDTESSGVRTDQDRIVTAALVRLRPDTKPTRESYLINPGVEIPAEATAVHGVTTEHAATHGLPPADVLDVVVSKLADAIGRSVPIIGMNVVFDCTLLHFDCLRNGVPTLSARLGRHEYIAPMIDALVLDRHADKYRSGSRNLAALCAHYGVKHHGAHDSGYDALAAAEVARKIALRYPKVGELTLAELHAAQVKWKAEQNADRQSYFDRTHKPGQDRRVVETGWPLYDLATGGAS